ncbi:hypothetical protein TNCT_598151 [Trichonephila clavata]|uniref:Uncharacterized protein n=1 Tax=Trichonephila clavata TaxID=2740835 RepID=A0A8X6G6Q9_TRICU|nr:hypothetical protein TNCT_598151 [Trichonephila clavata]
MPKRIVEQRKLDVSRAMGGVVSGGKQIIRIMCMEILLVTSPRESSGCCQILITIKACKRGWSGTFTFFALATRSSGPTGWSQSRATHFGSRLL